MYYSNYEWLSAVAKYSGVMQGNFFLQAPSSMSIFLDHESAHTMIKLHKSET